MHKNVWTCDYCGKPIKGVQVYRTQVKLAYEPWPDGPFREVWKPDHIDINTTLDLHLECKRELERRINWVLDRNSQVAPAE